MATIEEVMWSGREFEEHNGLDGTNYYITGWRGGEERQLRFWSPFDTTVCRLIDLFLELADVERGRGW